MCIPRSNELVKKISNQVPELTVELEEDLSLAGGREVAGAGQGLEVQGLALSDVDLELFGNLWADQEVPRLELAHWPVLAAVDEEVVGNLVNRSDPM